VGWFGFVVASGSESQLEQPIEPPIQMMLNNKVLVRIENPWLQPSAISHQLEPLGTFR
jgi:hypothetical protein